MKRIASFMVALIMATSFSIPAFAEEEKRYVPIVPEFLEVGGDVVNIKAALNRNSSPEIKQFFEELDCRPGLVLLRQETANEYYRTNSGEYINIGDDRKWSIIFVVPSDTNYQFTYNIQYFDPLIYSDTRSMPMKIYSTPNGLKTVTYYYDYESKSFSTGSYNPSIGYFQFSYVIGSNVRSGSVAAYPYIDTITAAKAVNGKYETASLNVGKAEYSGVDRHYDWWIGKQYFNNDEKPIEHDPGSSSSEPDSSSSEPDSSSSEPSSSTPWEPDPEPDNPFNPFAPSSSQYEPYTPPDDDPWNDYDPTSSLPDVPSMPGLPDPPDMDDSDNPFNPPDMDDSDNPFTPPDMDDSDNPFKPPSMDNSDNPFKPPSMDDSDNPFTPPDMDDSDNPFKPPSMDDSGNPFTVPSLDNSDNPFKEPELDSSKSNPFSLESIFNLFRSWFS